MATWVEKQKLQSISLSHSSSRNQGSKICAPQKNWRKRQLTPPMCNFLYQPPWVFRSFANVQWGFEKPLTWLNLHTQTCFMFQVWLKTFLKPDNDGFPSSESWKFQKFDFQVNHVKLPGVYQLSNHKLFWVQLHENSPRNSLSSRYCHQTLGELCCAQSLELEPLIRLGVSFFTRKFQWPPGWTFRKWTKVT